MTYYQPPSLEEWRRIKAATRHRQYLARQVELDEGRMKKDTRRLGRESA